MNENEAEIELQSITDDVENLIENSEYTLDEITSNIGSTLCHLNDKNTHYDPDHVKEEE